MIDKMIEHSKENNWSEDEAKNAANFARIRGGEQIVYLWTGISKTQVLPNIQSLHSEIGSEVVDLVRKARGLGK